MTPWNPKVVPQAGARTGDLVAVPLAAEKGDPKAPLVAVRVKPLSSSVTIWASLALLGGAILDAILEVALPMISSNEPLDLEKAWRPVLVAVLSAVIAWRRKSQNDVIGSAGD